RHSRPRHHPQRMGAQSQSQVRLRLRVRLHHEELVKGTSRIAHTAMRRLFDLTLGLLLLTAAAPILVLIALAVWAQDRGPVFYRQDRVGRHGKTFAIWKFRSMRVDNAGAAITSSGDDRITPAGRFLRRFKLDELPQL